MEVIKRARAVTMDLVVYKPGIKENSAFRSSHSSPSYVLMKCRYINFCHQLIFFAINFHSPGDYVDILKAFIIWSYMHGDLISCAMRPMPKEWGVVNFVGDHHYVELAHTLLRHRWPTTSCVHYQPAKEILPCLCLNAAHDDDEETEDEETDDDMPGLYENDSDDDLPPLDDSDDDLPVHWPAAA